MPKSPNFKALLEESVSFLDAPQSDGVPKASLALKATSNLWDTVLATIKVLGASFAAYMPQLKAATLAVYDEKIAPFDVPIIPNTVEPMFDGMLRGLIEKGFDSLIVAPLPVSKLMGAGRGNQPNQPSMLSAHNNAEVSIRAAEGMLSDLEDNLA